MNSSTATILAAADEPTRRYAERMATQMLASLEHYGRTSPAVSDGRVSTPAYYASKLGLVVNHLGLQIPGDGYWWWGDRFAALATELLAAAEVAA